MFLVKNIFLQNLYFLLKPETESKLYGPKALSLELIVQDSTIQFVHKVLFWGYFIANERVCGKKHLKCFRYRVTLNRCRNRLSFHLNVNSILQWDVKYIKMSKAINKVQNVIWKSAAFSILEVIINLSSLYCILNLFRLEFFWNIPVNVYSSLHCTPD